MFKKNFGELFCEPQCKKKSDIHPIFMCTGVKHKLVDDRNKSANKNFVIKCQKHFGHGVFVRHRRKWETKVFFRHNITSP